MSDSAAETPAANQSLATSSSEVPVPRLGTPAAETAAESTRGERDAVGDEPDLGGLTPTDDAQ